MPKPSDLHDLNFASDVQISGDGHLVAFVVSKASSDRKAYESAIHLSRDGAPATQFTGGKGKDASPRFSHDATLLAFTRSTWDCKAQLMLMPIAGGEALAITGLKSGVSNPRWSPDNQKIAFLSRGDWEDSSQADGQPRIVTSLRYKKNELSGAGIMPDEPLQLWVYDLETAKASAATKHPADIESFDWVDDERLVFTAAVSLEASASWATQAFLVKLGKKKAQQLTQWSGSMASIAVSSDGQQAAVIADPDFANRPGDPHVHTFSLEKNAVLHRVSSVDVLAGNTVNSDAHLGAYPHGPFWLAGGELIALHQFGGSGAIARITKHSKLERLTDDATSSIAALSANAKGDCAYLQESAFQPLEVFVKRGKTTRQVSHLNAPQKGSLESVTLERDGFTVEGWVLKPHGWKRNKSYPLVLNVHGGPATAWGHAYMHEFHALAAQGYAVCFCNIRGSTGYGDAQTAGTDGVYGAGDYDDLMAFLNICLERCTWLDGERAAIVGGSYGGVMTNWVISHTTRFKAAITDRSICNWVSMYGTSDIGYRFVERELRGAVPQNADRLWQLSPLRYAAAVKTPCLIVHSEEDHRCPIEQAEQWFVALKSAGVPVRFVRVPGENHELSRSGRPDRREFRLREYLDWLGEWL